MSLEERFELGQPELDGRPAAAADTRARSASNGFFRVVAWLMQAFMVRVQDPVIPPAGRLVRSNAGHLSLSYPRRRLSRSWTGPRHQEASGMVCPSSNSPSA